MNQRIEAASNGVAPITIFSKVRLHEDWYHRRQMPVPDDRRIRFVTDIRLYKGRHIEVETCYETDEGPAYMRFAPHELEVVE